MISRPARLPAERRLAAVYETATGIDASAM